MICQKFLPRARRTERLLLRQQASWRLRSRRSLDRRSERAHRTSRAHRCRAEVASCARNLQGAVPIHHVGARHCSMRPRYTADVDVVDARVRLPRHPQGWPRPLRCDDDRARRRSDARFHAGRHSGRCQGRPEPGSRAAGAPILLSNTYHLYLRPGDDLIARRGGLHRSSAGRVPS